MRGGIVKRSFAQISILFISSAYECCSRRQSSFVWQCWALYGMAFYPFSSFFQLDIFWRLSCILHRTLNLGAMRLSFLLFDCSLELENYLNIQMYGRAHYGREIGWMSKSGVQQICSNSGVVNDGWMEQLTTRQWNLRKNIRWHMFISLKHSKEEQICDGTYSSTEQKKFFKHTNNNNKTLESKYL